MQSKCKEKDDQSDKILTNQVRFRLPYLILKQRCLTAGRSQSSRAPSSYIIIQPDSTPALAAEQLKYENKIPL